MLASALKPTPWIQSDDPAIMALARPIAAMHASADRKMALLTEVAANAVAEVNFVGHFSASETLRRGEGDCTGTAVLLAALGRAAGIPTRVADGLVYTGERYHGVGNAFMPHSWTLAYVEGRWRSYDAALPSFDSTHIALTIGDGDERRFLAAEQLAGLLRWQQIIEVRTPPGG
jgi:transglutaminase-like putative cysteine protease